MDKETINLIIKFMERSQLTGAETPAFNKCIAALVAELQEPIKVESEDN